MTTPDADKIAEAMARNCAIESASLRFPHASQNNARGIYFDETVKVIHSTIPLTQLIKVAIAAKSFDQKEYVMACKDLRDALNDLKKQMPELFV